MVKAHAPKRRYVMFEVLGNEFSEEELKNGIYAEALKFFGEYGSSFVQLKLVEYNAAEKRGILRCARDKIEDVLGFLALVEELNGKKARLLAKRTSGTINKLKEKEATDRNASPSSNTQESTSPP